MVEFKINGISVEAQKGETILQVARKNDIYIPTMCYLAKSTPNASCRMCVVEAEGVEGFVLSCNTPPTQGLEVKTDSNELYTERQNIMKLYNVNHPLQCGVCDKSGECDLQNKTLDFDVDEQTFATRDQKRKAKKWGVLSYDPGLCIMCEKCTAVCNEVVGSEALYIKPGGYKSVIDNHYSSCIQCGECISVCPVGAMASADFKYKSNAWELEKIPSACAHCSSACNLNYEVKSVGFTNIANHKEILRVTNEDDHDSLCGGGRFGYDFDNKDVSKDVDSFSKVVESFKSAKSIRFGSMITNEEAYLLQMLKNLHGYKLINNEAKAFQSFLNTYSSVSGESLYSADLKDVAKSDFVITLGCAISNDNPMVRFALSQAVNRNKAYVAMMHPIEDSSIQNIVTQHLKHEVGSEEGLMAMLCELFVNEQAKEENKAFFDSLDSGYISGETNIGEEEFELLKRKIFRKSQAILVIGADVYSHPQALNIAKMAAILNNNSDFKVVMIPTNTNTLGVSLICDLDDEEISPSIGYNAKGDTLLSALGLECDLDMPAMNQQEGTFTTVNKEVVPLNAAVPYGGYELSDIARELGVVCEHVIDFTSQLPTAKGFKSICFDDLENSYTNSGEQNRGYKLDIVKTDSVISIDDISDIKEFNGSVLYTCNPISQFNLFTDKAHEIIDKAVIIGSHQFADAAKIKSGEELVFTIGKETFKRKFHLNSKLKGTVAYNPDFDLIEKSSLYRYQQVKFERV